jgi:hypothetical protein
MMLTYSLPKQSVKPTHPQDPGILWIQHGKLNNGKDVAAIQDNFIS